MDEENKINGSNDQFKIAKITKWFGSETSDTLSIPASIDDLEEAKKDIRNEIIQERW